MLRETVVLIHFPPPPPLTPPWCCEQRRTRLSPFAPMQAKGQGNANGIHGDWK